MTLLNFFLQKSPGRSGVLNELEKGKDALQIGSPVNRLF